MDGAATARVERGPTLNEDLYRAAEESIKKETLAAGAIVPPHCRDPATLSRETKVEEFSLEDTRVKFPFYVVKELKNVCSSCGETKRRIEHLRDHIVSAHFKLRFPCPHCSQDFAYPRHRLRHIRRVHTPLPPSQQSTALSQS